MLNHLKKAGGRRSFLKGAAGVLGAGFWADEMLEALPQNTNTNSKPSDLRITDLRIATVGRAPMTCPIIRIDTNQGICGLGEVRDGASKNYALLLKSRLLRENPCNVDKVFRKIKLATSGGILETKKIGDACQEMGVPMAMHFAGTPVSVLANVHCAAATENFLVMENHSVDVPWWDTLVEGVEKPIVNKGYISVPDKPGLGITLNDEVVKQHLAEPGFFEPTPQWNTDRTNDRQWS